MKLPIEPVIHLLHSAPEVARWRAMLEPDLPAKVALLGLDCFGIDYVQNNRRSRFRFAACAASAEQFLSVSKGFVASLR